MKNTENKNLQELTSFEDAQKITTQYTNQLKGKTFKSQTHNVSLKVDKLEIVKAENNLYAIYVHGEIDSSGNKYKYKLYHFFDSFKEF